MPVFVGGGSSETPAVGTFDMWYALSTNNQVFQFTIC